MKSPSRIVAFEDSQLLTISNMDYGDVFLRQGTAHMRIRLAGYEDTLRIVNLLTGNSWIPETDEAIIPVTDVKLTYRSNR